MPVSWFSLFLPDWLYWSGPYFFANTLNGHFFFLYQWVAWLQGIQRTCERSFLCVKRFLQNRYCRQQSIQFHSSAFERNTLCSIFSWTTFWWSGNWWWAPILQGSELQLSKIILIFPCIKHFSSWRLYFHFWSIFLSRKMSDLYCTKGFICQNGSKSMGSPKLIRQFKFCCVLMELFW